MYAIYLVFGSYIALLQLKYCIISFDDKIFVTFYVLLLCHSQESLPKFDYYTVCHIKNICIINAVIKKVNN